LATVSSGLAAADGSGMLASAALQMANERALSVWFEANPDHKGRRCRWARQAMLQVTLRHMRRGNSWMAPAPAHGLPVGGLA
jgi:hypothetical protein